MSMGGLFQISAKKGGLIRKGGLTDICCFTLLSRFFSKFLTDVVSGVESNFG